MTYITNHPADKKVHRNFLRYIGHVGSYGNFDYAADNNSNGVAS